MRSRRDLLLLLPAIPAAALVATPWLPFVNAPRLWLGLPSMLVWPALWVLAIVPALAAVEWGRTRVLEQAVRTGDAPVAPAEAGEAG